MINKTWINESIDIGTCGHIYYCRSKYDSLDEKKENKKHKNGCYSNLILLSSPFTCLDIN
jgi:hypothetical protein